MYVYTCVCVYIYIYIDWRRCESNLRTTGQANIVGPVDYHPMLLDDLKTSMASEWNGCSVSARH